MPDSRIIKLNIGGTTFQTTKDTLTRFEGMFRAMLETEIPLEKDEFGSIFIDRDPKHFRLILNFMRDGHAILPDSDLEVDEIYMEASYYLLEGLAQMCQLRNQDDRQLKGFRHIEGKTELLKTTLHSKKPFLVFFYEPENVVRVENFFNEGVFPATMAHFEKFIEDFEAKFDFYYTPVASCLITYLFIIGFTIFNSKWSPQHSLDVYQPVFWTKNQKFDVWDRCDLPKLDIWDDELIPYLDTYSNPMLLCNRSTKVLTFLRNGSWGVEHQLPNVKCRARCHWRQDERNNEIGKWSEIQGPVACEVLETACSENDVDFYGYLHTQIEPTPKREPIVQIDEPNQYDVIVIILDSLSYSQAKRSLPHTISYMTDHMNAVVFPYVNRVGENSLPNGVGLLFGKLIQKLERSLFEEENVSPDWSFDYTCNVFKDNETSLFREFQDHGYKTLFAEDWAEGVLNWPDCKGFDKPPVDHNMRPFQNTLERTNHGLNVTQYHLGTKNCREHHHAMLEYLGQFITVYRDKKKFSLIWASILGHDSENGFFHADHDFHGFLMQYRAQLENSFVFFMGDHGLRMGDVRKTFVGAVDVSNPFLAVSIPKKLRETTQILDLMKKNAQSLQTHFDTRATILDILKYQPSRNFTGISPFPIPNEKGNSFIRMQPDDPRNCRTMPIPLEYCLCQFNKSILETNTTSAEEFCQFMTRKVNQEIANGNFSNDCILMELQSVTSLLRYNEKIHGSTLYTVQIEMKEPSKASFRANIKMKETEDMEVMGMVERSNKYGNTADCILSEHHRPYCYCKNQPTEQ